MPWSPQPQIMARTKASHIRLPAEPAEHRVVSGTLGNRRRMGQEARRLERTFGPSRFDHLRRPVTPPPASSKFSKSLSVPKFGAGELNPIRKCTTSSMKTM